MTLKKLKTVSASFVGVVGGQDLDGFNENVQAVCAKMRADGLVPRTTYLQSSCAGVNVVGDTVADITLTCLIEGEK